MPVPKLDTHTVSDSELMTEQKLNLNSYHRLDDAAPYGGQVDKFGEIRLRLATIDSPEINRTGFDSINELDTTNVVNVNSGKVTLKWEDVPGGVVRPTELSGTWKYNPDQDSINPEERDFNNNTITSSREMVDLTSPFIWTGDANYCGFNYIPPIGSRVIVGFRKHGFPLILGYLPKYFKVLYPVLKPGEMCIKGHGNNYTHWRHSDKLDMKVWSNKGEIDKDDPYKKKENQTSNVIWLRLNANDGYILMSVTDSTNGKTSAFNISGDVVTVTTGTYNLQVRDLINIDAPKITQN